MKKIIYTIAILVFFSSCGKLGTLINFDVTYRAKVAVPDSPPASVSFVELPVVSIGTEYEKHLDQYNAKAGKVRKSNMILFYTETHANFDYLDSIHVYLSTPDQPEILIARKSIIPKSQYRLYLQTAKDENLKDYFRTDSIYLRTELYINKMPKPGTNIDLVPTMYVEARSIL